MNYYLLFLIPVALGGFVGFWCLVVKLVALLGWRRLATHFAVAELPAGRRFAVAEARIGGMRYRGALDATVTADGLGLVTGVLFRVGHPPLLIPWSAFGPFRAEKVLWTTFYATEVPTSTGPVALVLAGSSVMEAARPWVQVSAAG